MATQKVGIVVRAGQFRTHHFRSLEPHLAECYVSDESCDPRTILRCQTDLVITFDEHYCELSNLFGVARQNGVATLQVMNGTPEWRRTWDYTRNGRLIV